MQGNTPGWQSSEGGSRSARASFQREQGGEGGWVTGSPYHLGCQPFPSLLQDTSCSHKEALRPAHGVLISRPDGWASAHLLIHCVQWITFLFNVCSPDVCMPLTGLEDVITSHGGNGEKQFDPMFLGKATRWMSLPPWLDVSCIVRMAPANTGQEGPALWRDDCCLVACSRLLESTSSTCDFLHVSFHWSTKFPESSYACPWVDAPCNRHVLPWSQQPVDLGHSFQKLGCQPFCLLKFGI